MSAGLEFFSVDLDQVRRAIGSGSRRLLVDVLRAKQPAVSQYYGADEFAEGPTFEQGMRAWILGPVPPGPRVCTSLGEAVALMSLVEFFGHTLGSLVHVNESGDEFRDLFLHGTVVRWLEPPFPVDHLLSRPLFGQIRDMPPYWGHLTRDELAGLARPLLQFPPQGHYDSDVDEWAEELAGMLDWAVEEKRDLVTFYG
jgi:hypothetical protein